MADWLLRTIVSVDMVIRPRYNNHVAKQKKRERTMLNAVLLALVATLVAAVVPFIVLCLIPGSVLSHLLGVYTVSGATPSADLLLTWKSYLGIEEAYTTFFAMLVGGIALGLLAPSRITLTNRALAAAKMCFGAIVVCFLFSWTAELVSIQFKLAAYMLPLRLMLVQAALFVGWTAIGALGGYVGGLIRSRTSGNSGVAGQSIPGARATN
jgi:hypothetical protein